MNLSRRSTKNLRRVKNKKNRTGCIPGNSVPFGTVSRIFYFSPKRTGDCGMLLFPEGCKRLLHDVFPRSIQVIAAGGNQSHAAGAISHKTYFQNRSHRMNCQDYQKF